MLCSLFVNKLLKHSKITVYTLGKFRKINNNNCTIGSLIFKGTASGIFQIFHGKSHDFLWYIWIFHRKSCGITRYFTGSHMTPTGQKDRRNDLPSREKIGRGESCESTSPVNYEECASRPYLSYRNLQTSVGLVVAMVKVSYTMPTCGVS